MLLFELEDELASEFEGSWILHTAHITKVASGNVVVEVIELRVIEGVNDSARNSKCARSVNANDL